MRMFSELAVMGGISAFIQGIENTRPGMIISIVDGVAFCMGLSWLFGIIFECGFYGYVVGYGSAAYGFTSPGIWCLLSGNWEKGRVFTDGIMKI